MRRWRPLLFKLILLVLSLTGLEVLGTLVFKAAIVSFLYPDLASTSGWTLGLFVAAFSALLVFGLGVRRRFLRPRHELKESPLVQAVPSALTHECLIFKHGRTIAAIGFVVVRRGWKASVDTFLSALTRFCKQAEQLAVAAAFPITGQPHTYVMIRTAAESQREAIQRITTVGGALAHSLSQRGIAAEWVHDSLGVEQIYWLSVLGKEFHEDVTLDYRDGTLQARVGTGSTRALATASVPLENIDTRDGLLNLPSESPPYVLVFQLSPLDSNVIRKQLYKQTAARPEALALIDTLGPDLALETLAGRLNSGECAAVANLYRGCREGLWQCTCHLICAPQDLESFAAQLGCNPILLDPSLFGEVATIAPSADAPATLLPTSRLVRLLRESEPRDHEPSAPASASERHGAESFAEPVSSRGEPP